LGSVERQLHGTVTFEWRPEGLRCVMSVPRPKVQTGPIGVERLSQKSAKGKPAAAARRAGRIMIVEDEALIAMVLVDHLQELGLVAVGPFSRVADALKVEGEVDAAILDVNLAGESVYPVADMLKARGVPFLFMTGYGSASIDPHFADVPVLQKPIEAKTLEDMLLDRNLRFNLHRDNDLERVQRQAV
jgi:CheY-like chemotaxis protein